MSTMSMNGGSPIDRLIAVTVEMKIEQINRDEHSETIERENGEYSYSWYRTCNEEIAQLHLITWQAAYDLIGGGSVKLRRLLSKRKAKIWTINGHRLVALHEVLEALAKPQ